MTGAVAALLLLAAIPCELPEAGPEDRERAAAYADVGDAERAAGSRGTAAAAYREALRHHAADARAREGLLATCGPPTSAPAGSEADAARADGDPVAALVAGTAEFRAGRADRARPLLEQALGDPETADAARLLLGAIAQQEGDAAAARALLDRAASGPDPRVSTAAAGLLAAPWRDDRLAIAGYAGASWDSNATLAPDGTDPAESADGAATTVWAVRLRPFGATGPFASAGLEYRDQRRFAALDLAGWFAGGGLRVAGRRGVAGVEYRYRELALGGAPYVDAHLARVEASVGSGRRGLLAATLEVERTQHVPDWAAAFAGTRAGGALRAGWIRGAAWGAVAYRAGRLWAGDAALSFLEHGPALEAGWAPARRLRLWLDAAALARRFDAFDPALEVVRTETALEARLTADLAIAGGVAARAELSARRTVANVAELTHGKVAAAAGLVWEAAWP